MYTPASFYDCEISPRADQAVKTRTALVMRYERLFEWLRQFTEHSISLGYAEYEGKRKYLAGLRSSNIDKRNKAVKAAIRC
jgi:hypothetical protein